MSILAHAALVQQGRLVMIFPRKKMGEAARGSSSVWLSMDILQTLFDLSLPQAAKHMVCAPLSCSLVRAPPLL